ncbi:rho GTPase-activating protein 100F-like isoform X1 [Haliotis cracherodii]|uniref:rho GTPase-activating protein 100F-like isoform X1 n=2 Tax=Haliotis cracherodii TaxID=6455 RepID=UPI0039E83596
MRLLLVDQLLDAIVGMFCCGRLQEEEESMAQSPDRYKSPREKGLAEEKRHERLTQGGPEPASSSRHSGEDNKTSHGTTHSRHVGTASTDASKGDTTPKTTDSNHGAKSKTSNGAFEMGIKSMEVLDDSFVVQTVEIIKRPGQTLGFYIREGNGFDRQDGVFISRIQMGTVAESNGLLHVGDEILTVNNVKVGKMSLDDVVILMSIPKKLVLTIRTRRNCNKNKSCPSLALTEKDEELPIVVLKKGRSSSASQLEMTEKCPDAFESYAQHPFYSADFATKREPLPEKPTSSRYASIFISPQRAEARLLPDESMDSGNSSDGSLPRSHGSGDSGTRDRLFVGGASGGVVEGEGMLESPGSYLSPSSTMLGQHGFSGDREYLKYLIPDGFGRRQPPKSPSKTAPISPHMPPGRSSLSDDSTGIYSSESPYAQSYRDYVNVSYRGFHEDRRSQERLRDLLHSKSRYGRLLRSRSPECYNSDSEILYTHPRPVDSRGFASDYETYAGAISDDDGPVYSIPHLPASSSSELQQLLKKFTTLSQELQQEQSKLQRQLSQRDKRGSSGMAGGRASDGNVSDDYGQRSSSGRASPLPVRKSVAATQTPGNIHARLARKTSTDSSGLVFRPPYQQTPGDESTESSPEQRFGPPAQGAGRGSMVAGGVAGGLPISTSQSSGLEGGIRPASRFRDLQFTKKPLHIPYSEFEPYKADIRKRVEISRTSGLDGLLGIHVMSGQGLKSSKTSLRDLYCVVAVDSINKARTMIRTGAINFDWDEAFDVELEDSKEVSFLIYHWDPNYKHRLCFHGSVLLPGYVLSGQKKFVAIKMEPKGILFVAMLYKEPAVSLQRLPSVKKNALFGVDLETVIQREKSILNVPLLVHKCIEEIERRGLETIGIYRLCGSARRKVLLREAFEKNAQAVDLSPENVSDVHVITGVLKDYLRELPEPLFTNALYQMLLDALSVRLPSDPEGSATLMLSILECLPKANQDTMTVVLNHLKRVASNSDKNKMTLENLAICLGPALLCPSPATSTDAALDFKKHIEVLLYLLQIWDNGSNTSTSKSSTADTVVSVETGSGGGTTAESSESQPRQERIAMDGD